MTELPFYAKPDCIPKPSRPASFPLTFCPSSEKYVFRGIKLVWDWNKDGKATQKGDHRLGSQDHSWTS